MKEHRHKESAVPCDGCTVCCEGDLIFLHPEHGDDPGQYKIEEDHDTGLPVLQHKSNGDCIYLDRGVGCSIWDRRPSICRYLDCRVYLQMHPQDRRRLLRAGRITRRLVNAANEARRRGMGNG